jgi:hypothetical protein
LDESSGNSDSDGGFDSDVRTFYTLVNDYCMVFTKSIQNVYLSFF